MKNISNTKFNNVSITIYEMITWKDLPIERYNNDNLVNYLYANFTKIVKYLSENSRKESTMNLNNKNKE